MPKPLPALHTVYVYPIMVRWCHVWVYTVYTGDPGCVYRGVGVPIESGRVPIPRSCRWRVMTADRAALLVPFVSPRPAFVLARPPEN